MTSCYSLRRVVLFGALSLVAALGMQAAPSEAQIVDFVAVNADGTLVTDLKLDQFAIKVGGKDRVVTSLELVRFNSASGLLPPPFSTNLVADAGRDYVLVVDEESLRPGTENLLRDAILLLEQSLNTRDRIGLFAIPRGSISLAPTSDRAPFRAAVSAIAGRAKPASSPSDHRCHTRDVLTGVTSILGSITNRGAATPVVLFSVGLVGPSTATTTLGAASEDCTLLPDDFQRVGPAAETARAQFFVIRPEESVERGLSEGLEHIAGVTGGQMLFMGSDIDSALGRVASETSAYYLATLATDASERSGSSQRLELRTSRTGVTLRARASVAPASPRRGGTPNPKDMLRTAAVERGFALRAMTITSRNDSANGVDTKSPAKLVGLAEAIDPSVSLAAAAAGVYDSTGKLVAQWTATPDELRGSPMAAALVVPHGTYRVRIAAVDTQGRAATTDSEINTEMTSAAPAQVGGLLVGTAGTTFMPRLQFSDEAEVMVYFELYGRPAGPFGAIVEIAASLDGPALVEAQPTPAATAVADKFIFTATLPIGPLKPGDYVVRAKIGFEGQPTGVLTRTIRKQ